MTADDIQALALRLRGASRVVLWEKTEVYKVRGKVFAVCDPDEGLSFKVSQIAYAVLTEDGTARQAKGFARGHWVSVRMDVLEPEDAAGWLKASYDLVIGSLTRQARAELGL